MEGSAQRAAVLGFDGMPWELVSRWAERGELPNFAELLTEGAAGPFESTTPPTTPMAWPSLATGVWPDKHGIYGFHRLTADYSHRMNTSEQVVGPCLWELIEPAAVANVPMTYPAPDIDGELVAGMMAPTMNDQFTHPPDLASTIEEEIPNYQIGLDWSDYGEKHDEFLSDLNTLLAARRALMRRHLRKEWRLFFVVFTAPDRLQHLIWDEEVLLKYYRTFDDILGEVMQEVAGNRCTLYVVSDHGFGPISKFVHVNTVLEQEGLLSRSRSGVSRRLLDRIGVTKSSVLDALERVGIDDDTVVRHVPVWLLDGAANRIPGDHVLHDVDFSRTVAFLHGSGNVYVNDMERFEEGTVASEERPARKREIIRALSEVTEPNSTGPVIEVRDGSSLFPTDPYAPDVVVTGTPGFHVRMSLSPEPLMETGDVAAYHRKQGIFFAWGDDVASGVRVEDASVVDLAPTVLHGLGQPVPERVDGRVLMNIFEVESAPGQRSVRKTSHSRTPKAADRCENDLHEVEERLRGLGYLE